jgi:hypothetical protein
MTMVTIAVGVVSAAITVGTTVAVNEKNKKAEKKAQQQAVKDANIRDYNAKKAEQFAETEGQGIGTVGEINMQVDNEIGTGTIKDTLGLTL